MFIIHKFYEELAVYSIIMKYRAMFCELCSFSRGAFKSAHVTPDGKDVRRCEF
jgi:hypothetical protein